MGLGRFKFFPIVLCILSGITLTVSTITNYWYEIKDLLSEITKSYEGLWKKCGLLGCQSFASEEVDSWFQAVRAFMVLAIISTILAVVFFILSVKFERITILYPCFILTTGLLSIFALTLYGVKKKTVGSKQYSVKFGWSYIASWAGASVSVVAAIVGFIGAKRQA